ncbi:MAG: glycerophosphodiester phosphodiesterase [Clostridia bacterium]|nr:glycerophosphodiester phosphodiesterase [Clostridia bacterium]
MDIFKSWIVEQPIAHRGFFNYADAPENTLAAFERAIEHNYAIELDVQIIADGTPVVFHDNELSRLTGKDGYVQNLKMEDLPKYTIGSSKQTIPTLKQVLELVNGRTPILLEVKNGSFKPQEDCAKIYEAIKDYKGEIAIQSFNPYALEWFANNAPKYPRGLLSSMWRKKNRDVEPDIPSSAIVRFATRRLLLFKKAKPDFLNYEIRDLPNRFVRRHKNIPLLSWVAYNQAEYTDGMTKADNIVFQDFEPKM